MKLLLVLMSIITFYSGTPGLDVKPSDSWVFRGYVDVNMDSIPEKIFTADNLYVTDSFDRVLYTVPLDEGTEKINIPLWTVTKDNRDFSISGNFDYETDDETYTFVSYKIENGKPVFNKAESEDYTESGSDVYNGDGTVMYIGDALDRSEEDYLSGLALDDYNELMSEAARFRDENGVNFSAIIDVNDDNKSILTFSWNGGEAYINGEIEEDYPVSWGYYFFIYNQGTDENEYNPYIGIVNFGPGTAQEIVPVFLTNEGKLFYPLTKYGIGQGFHYDADTKEMIASDRRWGDFWDEDFNGGDFSINEITLGGEETHFFNTLTKKDYWFFYDGVDFYEYVGKEITIDTFKKISGGDEAIKLIAEKNGEITSILYRENGIYNINYRVESDTEGFYFNYYDTYRFDKKLTLIEENGWGVYLPSILEDFEKRRENW
jgi:hypothetical protein